MKKIIPVLCVMLLFCTLAVPVQASEPVESFNIDEQLDALGKDELMAQVPEGAKELLQEAGIEDVSAEKLLQLSPRNFFKVLWRMLVRQVKMPANVLASLLGIVILCAMLGGLRDATGNSGLESVFSTVSVLCVLTAITAPILNCIVETAQAIRQASLFMLSFIPMFAAALTASGQPVTGATYNVFLFSFCQIVSQVVSGTLMPLMGIYLALCIVGPLAPGINMSYTAASLKSLVSWALGLIITVFVGLLSVQTLVAQSADSVTARAAKFLIGSFVPVVGSALSEAYTAARGCLGLLKTTLGAYGILVAALTFLPVLLHVVIWYFITNLAVIGSDILGVGKVSDILKSCGSVLGILVAVILCYMLLLIVSITVVLVTGTGAA